MEVFCSLSWTHSISPRLHIPHSFSVVETNRFRVICSAAQSQKANQMTVSVTGATGFIGTRLVQRLHADNHNVCVLTRSKSKAETIFPVKNFPGIVIAEEAGWKDCIEGSNAVVNLAGMPISTRWSPEIKKEIKESRIRVTSKVVDLINSSPQGVRPTVLVSATAVGYYGSGTSETRVFDENSPSGNDYLAEVCREWEGTALKVDKDVRLALIRIGVVLGKDGGALAKMIPLFMMFAGGPLGSGQQWFSWIHLDDIVNLIYEALSNPSYKEIQQRAVEYFALSRKGAAVMDILGEMPKFPERQSSLIKKAEDAEADTAEQSALKLRAQQQPSNALVVTDQHPSNGEPLPVFVGQLSVVKAPNMNNTEDHSSTEQVLSQENGNLSQVDQQPPSADPLSDLLGPLAIEGPPGATVQYENSAVSGLESGPDVVDGSAIVPVEVGTNTIQPIGNIAVRFHALCLKDSGVLYEDPYIQIGIKAEWRAHQGRLVLFLGNKNTSPLVSVQALILPPAHLKMELSLVPDTIPPRAQVQCPLEVVNLRPSRDVAVLDFSYKFGTHMVNIKLRLPAVLNKFLQPLPVSAEEFFPQWRSLSGPPLKLQEVVRGVRPMALPEMANLLHSYRIAISPGLDPNPNNLVASTTFYSENTRAIVCLVRIETDPADRTQLRMTLASGDPTLTFELKEFIKEQLVSIPTVAQAPTPAPPAAPPTPQIPPNDPAALLTDLL